MRAVLALPVLAVALVVCAGCGSQSAAVGSTAMPVTWPEADDQVVAPTTTAPRRKYGVYGFPGESQLNAQVSDAVQKLDSYATVGLSFCTLQTDTTARCYVEYVETGQSHGAQVAVSCASIDEAGGHECDVRIEG